MILKKDTEYKKKNNEKMNWQIYKLTNEQIT